MTVGTMSPDDVLLWSILALGSQEAISSLLPSG